MVIVINKKDDREDFEITNDIDSEILDLVPVI